MRKETLSWNDVEALLEHLLPQLKDDFDSMLIVTRGGIIPGGLIAEALNITSILTAAVNFPAEMHNPSAKLLSWPQFLQFPDDALIHGRRILIVDDVWGSGRTITAVKNRVTVGGGVPLLCVLHFNPARNLFKPAAPDYYAATTDAFIIYPWELRGASDMTTGWSGQG
jgi:hypoxanthine phosphoribosyltransferase